MSLAAVLGTSRIVLGTWTFAGDAIWGASEEAAAVDVVQAALDAGVTLFDTAPNYGDGRSEALLGRALRGVDRAAVATKLKVDGLDRSQIEQKIDESRRRLKRDRIDLFQIHWPALSTEETARALDVAFDLRERGVIGNVGVCNFGEFDIAEHGGREIVSNQLPYSLLWRVIEGGIADASRAAGVPTVAYTVLQQGLLGGRYRSVSEFPAERMRVRLFSGDRAPTMHAEVGHEEAVDAALSALQRLAAEAGVRLPRLAIGFVSARPFIDRILVGARSVEQLCGVLDAVAAPLDSDLVARLDAATELLRQALGGNPDMYRSASRVRFRGAGGRPVRR